MKLKGQIINLLAPGKIEFEDVELDTDKIEPTEVIARTLFSAISPGTETAAYSGKSPLRPGKIYPRLLGYCNVALVVATGKAVKLVKKDDMILTGQSHRTIFAINEDEIMAKVPGGVPPEDAALTYLYNLGLTSLQTIKLRPSGEIAVIGLGVLGLAATEQAAQLELKVSALSNSKDKLKLAKELGADKTCLKAGSSKLEKIANLVITTSNSWEDWELALRLVKDQGIICVLGFPGRGLPPPGFNPLEPKYFYDKKISIIPTGAASGPDTIKKNCKEILGLMAKNKLSPKKLVSGIYGYRDIEQAYKKLLAKDGRSITYLLKWQA